VRLLLDTHTLLWWIADDSSLPPSARKLIAASNSEVLVSAVSSWEIATKLRLRKLSGADDLVGDFAGFLLREGFEHLPISIEHGLRAGLLTGPHKDPFDRMLVAQCQSENLPIVSNDRVFDSYKVRRLW
jgi:PIN domain nuclease of toxin-antitoxin system